jgi:hypothetical protein
MGAKNKAWEHMRLAMSYIRCKNRKWLRTIVKTWRHQAVYGRIDGLYTRKMLIDSLAEQKALSVNLQKSLAAQMIELEQCRDAVATETKHRQLLEQQLVDSAADLRKQVIIGHHGDQERKRLEAIIDAVAIINPKQMKHLKQLQMAFQFRIRKVVPSKLPDDYVDEDAQKLGVADADADDGSIQSVEQTPQNERDCDLEAGDENKSHCRGHGSTHEQVDLAVVAPPSLNGSIIDQRSVAEDSLNSKMEVSSEMERLESISYQDKLLLLRVKWLLGKFQSWEHDDAERAAAESAMAAEADQARLETEAAKDSNRNVDVQVLISDDNEANDGAGENADDNNEDEDEDDMNWDDEDDNQEPSADVEPSGPPPIVFPAVVVPSRPPIIHQAPTSSAKNKISLDQNLSPDSVEPRENSLVVENIGQLPEQPRESIEGNDLIALDATRVLFSLLEFIKDGNLTLLDAPDRQDWIRAVLAMVEAEKREAPDQTRIDIATAVQALEDMNVDDIDVDNRGTEDGILLPALIKFIFLVSR